MALNLTLAEDFFFENTTRFVDFGEMYKAICFSAKGPLTGLFDGIDLGLSKSFHQLLTALIAILAISAVVVSQNFNIPTIICFRLRPSLFSDAI
jgi:hypothetical protein